jgi:hypothetical protein
MKASKRFTANGFGDTHSTAGFNALTLGSIGRFTRSVKRSLPPARQEALRARKWF